MKDTRTLDDYYNEGCQARRDGVSSRDNPYESFKTDEVSEEIGMKRPWQWNFGWLDQLAADTDSLVQDSGGLEK